MKLSHSFCNLLVCLLLALPLEATPLLTWKQQLVRQAVVKYQWLEAYNRQNDRQGLSHLNQYVIELDANWVEERPNKVILNRNYPELVTMLKGFNEPRNGKDKLRFYVVVVNDYQVDLKETVDPAKLPDQVESLSQLVAPLGSKDHYARFKAEIASIPADIAAAMQAKDYQEKAIYFYGLIKLYQLDAKPRYYRYDNLSLLEGRLKAKDEAIRSKAREGIASNDAAGVKIEEVVANIINAIETVVDGKLADEKVICTDTYDNLIAKSAAGRTEAKMAEDARAMAQLLDNQSNNYLTPGCLAFDNPTQLRDADPFIKNILADKLLLLNQSHSNCDYKIYMVFKQVAYALPQAEMQHMAERVAQAATSINAQQSIVITVPYYAINCTNYSKPSILGLRFQRGTALLQTGVYCPDGGLQTLMQSAFHGTGNWEARFRQAYRHIPKRHVLLRTAINYTLDVLEDKVNEQAKTSGYDNIYDFVFQVDERLREYKALRTEGASLYADKAITEEKVQSYYRRSRELAGKPPTFGSLRHGLKEWYIAEEFRAKGHSTLARQYVRWFIEEQGVITMYDRLTSWRSFSPEDKYFEKGYNPEVIKQYYNFLDQAGLALGVADLDWITEGVSFLVAYHYQDTESQITYGASIAVPVAATVVVKVLKAWKEGKLMLKVGDDGTWHLVEEAIQGLANFPNIRNYLGDGQVKAYLNNDELIAFENLLKTADKGVLTSIDKLGIDDFAEMTRGYKDNPSAFAEGIKSFENFSGQYGWLNFWKLTPGMKNSLETIKALKGKLDMPTGNATDIQLASIHAFTASGDFINVPMRYRPSWFGEYNQRALEHIKEGLNELKKVQGRKIINERVYSGKTYSLENFQREFVGGMGKEVAFTGFVSSSKNQSVAEGFIDLTKKWAGNGDKVAVIRRITSKEGVYVDDLSDWGKNLGPTRHAATPHKLSAS
jgi:hypothetical protein